MGAERKPRGSRQKARLYEHNDIKTMQIDLDKFQILYYLEGCAHGSHLRQGCWHQMINLYPKFTQEERDFLYTYAKRDIAPLFGRSFADGSRPCGAENFDQFLACFDKDNRYMVTAQDGERTETAETYLYNGHYWTSGVMRFENRCITNIEKI